MCADDSVARMRGLLLVVALAVGAAPGDARAQSVAAPDERAIDARYREASARYVDGQFLTAARLWTAVGEMYPEEAPFKKPRARIYKDVAETYEKVIHNGGSLEIAREALGVLDRYAERFAAAYPGEAPHQRIAAVREMLRAQVDAADAAERARATAAERERPVAPPPTRPPVTPSRPWRGLMAGGGVLLGGGAALLGVAVGGGVTARGAERYVEDPAHQCYQPIAGVCAEYDARGHVANRMFVAGLVGAPLLLAAGATMVALAVRRKQAGRAAVTPVLSRSLIGLAWHGRTAPGSGSRWRRAASTTRNSRSIRALRAPRRSWSRRAR
jgi:hypothetical protein